MLHFFYLNPLVWPENIKCKFLYAQMINQLLNKYKENNSAFLNSFKLKLKV